jgi:hypothetical protein
MDMKEFAALLGGAAEHAMKHTLEGGGIFCRVELHRHGFRVYASFAQRDLRFQRVVPFETVFSAKFPLLEAEIDRVIAEIRAFAESHPDHAA